MDTFYRALISPSHREAWAAGRFNSYHITIPFEWQTEYYQNGRRNPDTFQRETTIGKFTKSGVENFVRLAAKYKAHSIWSESDVKQVCELEGVCAFRDVRSVLEYLRSNVYPDVVIVKFTGTYVSDIPESTGMSGVLVTPLVTLNLWTINDFQNEFAQ